MLGCGGVDSGENPAAEAVGSSAQEFATSSGFLHLLTFDNSTWSFDADGSGSWNPPIDQTQTGFGASGDIPLIGFGSVTCGAAGGAKGTYRPSTRQYFFDMNGNGLWDSGDVHYDNFTLDFGTATYRPFIFTLPAPGNTCKGVLGYTIQDDYGSFIWFIDSNDNKQYDSSDISGSFGGGKGNEDWPVPLWNASAHSSILTIFRRNTGEWFQDLNNNKKFDGCSLDGCTQFGLANIDLPFGHPNTIIRGTSRFTGQIEWSRNIDIDGNGWWDSSIDKSYPFRSAAFAVLY